MGDLRLWRVEFRRIRRGREELDTRYVYAKTAKMAEQAHPAGRASGNWRLKGVIEVTSDAISNRGTAFVAVTGLRDE
jgi:subtilisin-like proprotein convertase family protein